MSYGYPPPGGQGYPPQQPGYPSAPGGAPGGYPPAQGGYPPAPGGYPAASGGYPQSGGPSGYPPAPGGNYPPSGGYPAPGGIGFDSVTSQPPAQNYGQPGYGGGYPAPGYPAQAPYGAPQQPYGAPPHTSAPQQPYGAPPAATAPQPGYGAPPQGQGYPMPTQGQLYGQQAAQPQYGQAPVQPAYAQPSAAKHGKMAQVTQGMAAMTIKTHGTVVPHSPFDPEADAKVLRKAMKGLGTDEKAIISVIGSRTSDQRQQLKQTYKQAFGRDLVKDLKSELSGNFEDLVVAMFMKSREYDAYCLHEAMSGAGTTESTLIEILVSRSNSEIKEIRDEYKRLYKKDLEKALMSETSGHFRKLLVSLNNASRDTSTTVDHAKAQADAQSLYQAGEKKWGTDEATFNLIMASRGFPQLRATFDAYHKIANRDIVKSIKGEFSGDIEDGMVAVVDVSRNAPAYFAKRLHQSMKGLGTKDDALVRVVVSRCEVDMVEIKEQFLAMFKKTLPSYIKDDTSGDYKKLLLALVGN
ncbi:unnamed protein product [Clavelina lepadiformis]|uniref:Annexin n=1 Tax=Clavelina lepadiformis TaxID=159417 RepID=A0ABP0F404_CLALP